MGRGLATLGAILLLVTVALWIGDATGSVSTSAAGSWSGLTLKAGLVLLAAGAALRLFSPMAQQMGRGRCAECGHPVERGHTYCGDHMQKAVNAYRDQARDRMLRSGKSHT